MSNSLLYVYLVEKPILEWRLCMTFLHTKKTNTHTKNNLKNWLIICLFFRNFRKIEDSITNYKNLKVFLRLILRFTFTSNDNYFLIKPCLPEMTTKFILSYKRTKKDMVGARFMSVTSDVVEQCKMIVKTKCTDWGLIWNSRNSRLKYG